MSTRLKKVNAYVLLVVMMFAAVFANANMVFAKEDTSMQPENAVTYNETNTEATVQFDVTKVSDRWQVSQLISENGENGDDEAKENILYDRNDEALSNPKPVFTANENGTYKFRVKYASKAHSSSNGASANSDEQSGDDDGEAPTGKLKEKVFKVKVDGIAEKSEAAEQIGNIDMENKLPVVSRALGDPPARKYVANYGDDNTGDGSREKPYKTLQKVHDVLVKNDIHAGGMATIVLLTDIILTEPLKINTSGSGISTMIMQSDMAYPRRIKKANAFSGPMIDVQKSGVQNGNTIRDCVYFYHLILDGGFIEEKSPSGGTGGILVREGYNIKLIDSSIEAFAVKGENVASAIYAQEGAYVTGDGADVRFNNATGENASTIQLPKAKANMQATKIRGNKNSAGAMRLWHSVVSLETTQILDNTRDKEYATESSCGVIDLKGLNELKLRDGTVITGNKGVRQYALHVNRASIFLQGTVKIDDNTVVDDYGGESPGNAYFEEGHGRFWIYEPLSTDSKIGLITEEEPSEENTVVAAIGSKPSYVDDGVDKVFRDDSGNNSQTIVDDKTILFKLPGDAVSLNAAEAKAISQEKAKSFKDINQLKPYADVTATVNGQNAINNVSVEFDESNGGGSLAEFQQGTPGLYKINFKMQNEVKSTLMLIFPDNKASVSNSGDAYVTAYNNEIIPEQFKTLTTDSAINALMGAKGKTGFIAKKNPDGKDAVYATKTTPMTAVKPAGWDAARQAGKEGTYKIKFHNGLDGNDYAEITAVLTVKALPKPVVNADSVFVTQSQAKKLTDAEAIKALMNAKATIDGEPLNCELKSIGNGTLEDIKAGKIGTYDMTFSAASDISTESISRTLTIVADNTNISKDKRNIVSAKSTIITQTEAKKLAPSVADSKLIELNKAIGQTIGSADARPTAVIPKVTEVVAGSKTKIAKGVVGTYNFTYSLGEKGKDSYVEQTVSITVVEDGSSTNGTESVNAKNGTVKSSEARKFTDAQKAQVLIAKLSATAATVSPDGTVNNNVVPQVIIADRDWEAIKSGTAGRYSVTFKNGTQSKTVTLEVIADDVVIEVKPQKFILESELVQYFSDDKIKELFEVKASVGSEDATDDVQIKRGGTGQNQWVTFTIGNISKKALLFVFPDEDAHVSANHESAITKKNATITSNEFKSLTLDKLKEKLHAMGYIAGEGEELSQVQVVLETPQGYEAAQKAGTTGVYHIKIKNKNSGEAYAEKTAYLTVKENGTIISKDGKNSITAESLIMTYDQFKSEADPDGDNIVETEVVAKLHKVKAETMDLDGTWKSVRANLETIIDEKGEVDKGVLWIAGGRWFIGSKGSENYAAKEATLVIVSNDTVTNGRHSIGAKNSVVKSSEAKKFTDDKKAATLIEKLKAKAVSVLDDESLNMNVTPKVDIADKDWEAIKAGTAGKYSVTFRNSDQEKTVVLEVVADDTVIEGDTIIKSDTAKIIKTSEAKEYFNAEKLKELFNVHAYVDGEEVSDNVRVEYKENGNSANWQVTFTVDGAEKTTKLYLWPDDEGEVSKDHEHVAKGKNATITANQFRELTLMELNELIGAGSIAVNRADGTLNMNAGYMLTPSEDYAEAQKEGIPGVYTITIENNESGDAYVKRIVQLTVKDNSESEDGKNRVKAQSVIMTQSQISALGSDITDDILRDINKVTAETMIDGEWNKVTADVTDVVLGSREELAKATPGTYRFTYSIGEAGKENYAAKTVSIVVIKDGAQTDGIYSIDAKNAIVKSAEAKQFADDRQDEILIEKLQASAKSILEDGTVDDNVVPEVLISQNDWSSIRVGTVGEYSVTFKNGSQMKTVTLEVVADDTVIQGGVVIQSETMVSLSQSQVPQDNIDEALKRMFAVKGSVNGIDATDRIQVQYKGPLTRPARHKITFVLDGIEKEVVLYVFSDSNTSGSGNNISTKKNAATITSKQFKTLKLDELTVLLGAENTNVEGFDDEANITLETPDGYKEAQKAGKPGVYKIKVSNGLSEDKHSEFTSYLTVKEDGTEISKNGVNSVNAEDVKLSQSEIKLLDNEMSDNILTTINGVLAETSADDGIWNEVAAEVTEVETGSRKQLAEAVPGTYEFTYSVGEKGEDNYTAKTVSVTVEKDETLDNTQSGTQIDGDSQNGAQTDIGDDNSAGEGTISANKAENLDKADTISKADISNEAGTISKADNNTVNKGQNAKTKTSDMMKFGLFAVMLAISAGGIITYMLFGRRKRENK